MLLPSSFEDSSPILFGPRRLSLASQLEPFPGENPEQVGSELIVGVIGVCGICFRAPLIRLLHPVTNLINKDNFKTFATYIHVRNVLEVVKEVDVSIVVVGFGRVGLGQGHAHKEDEQQFFHPDEAKQIRKLRQISSRLGNI